MKSFFLAILILLGVQFAAASSDFSDPSSELVVSELLEQEAQTEDGFTALDSYPTYRCYAESRTYRRFSAVGRSPRNTQELAMRRCWEYSRYCRRLGCRRIDYN